MKKGQASNFLVAAALAVSASVTARAYATDSIVVLGLDSEDADDEATAIGEALENALKHKGLLAKGKPSSSFTTLSAAARCKDRPDRACLERISKLANVDDFIWGLVRKGNGSLYVELHRFHAEPGPAFTTKVKTPAEFAPAVAIQALLPDAHDATLVVTCAAPDGVLWVDGHARALFRNNQATTTTSTGPHEIEIRVAGKTTHQKTLSVDTSKATWSCGETLTDKVDTPTPANGKPPSNSGRIAGYSLLGAGALAATLATVFTVKFANHRSALNEARATIPATVTDVCSTELRGPNPAVACHEYQEANSSRTIAISAGAAAAALLAAGLYFTLRSEGSTPNATVSPSVSDSHAGATLTVAF